MAGLRMSVGSMWQQRAEELERENTLLRERLVQAQKLTALGELVSTTTHEFNNVLTTIINYAKIGLRNRDEATRDKALKKILDAGERAARITHGVLGMARNRKDRFERTHLADIVRETLFLLERELSKYRIHVECQLLEVPDVWGNGNLLQQVLLNLLINARQAMPDGGTLWIRLWQETDQGVVDLQVRDSGTGIPAERLPRIFEPFFTTKEGPDASGKGGTGLGLSACRDIIEMHQGRIRVESTVGKGTAFTMRLPVAAAVTPATVAPATASPLPSVSS
jgi:signal transduction histidine kinase